MPSFLQIPEYPNYEISTDGVIRNSKRGNTMNWVDNGKGYKQVKLYNRYKPQGRYCLVHRLVMSTFKPCGYSNVDVNHLDGNKANNCLANLEWTSKSDNTRHAHLTGLFKSRNKLTIEQVKEIQDIMRVTKENTARELAERYGVNSSIIYKISTGYLYGYV